MKSFGSRKNVEYNAFELIFALFCCNDNIKNKDDVMNANFEDYNDVLKGCTELQFQKYKEDVCMRKYKEIENYINNIKSQLHNIVKEEIIYVYLEGKNITTKKIKDLNKDVDIKKAKADVYIETLSGKMIGISIKQNYKCILTNYSVEKILGELVSKDLRKDLSKERKEVLKQYGINGKNIKKYNGHLGLANEIFYNSLEGTNSYWNLMRKSINNNIIKIKELLIDCMFPIGLKYELYVFNGNMFERLDKIKYRKAKFHEHIDYYFDKNEYRCEAAKMFYQLIVNNKIYKVEIAFKGNAWSQSAQFKTTYEGINSTHKIQYS